VISLAGALRYIGTGDSSNRGINLTGNGIIDNASAGIFDLGGNITGTDGTNHTHTGTGTGGIVEQVAVHDFNRDGPLHAALVRPIDPTHRTDTDQLFDPKLPRDDQAQISVFSDLRLARGERSPGDRGEVAGERPAGEGLGLSAAVPPEAVHADGRGEGVARVEAVARVEGGWSFGTTPAICHLIGADIISSLPTVGKRLAKRVFEPQIQSPVHPVLVFSVECLVG
jgi:hypothetical protein